MLFNRLLNKLGNRRHIRLESEGFMPLVIEKIGEGIHTRFGNALLYSLAHYYEQNGDVLRDPEMTFLVIDNREHPNTSLHLIIFPASFQQDNLGICQESVVMDGHKVHTVYLEMQIGQAQFANEWLNNLRLQGFI
jgi:hypothetical protein